MSQGHVYGAVCSVCTCCDLVGASCPRYRFPLYVALYVRNMVIKMLHVPGSYVYFQFCEKMLLYKAKRLVIIPQFAFLGHLRVNAGKREGYSVNTCLTCDQAPFLLFRGEKERLIQLLDYSSAAP